VPYLLSAKLWTDYGRCGSCRTLGYFLVLSLINDVVFMVYISLKSFNPSVKWICFF
jgi:hypothetical protein